MNLAREIESETEAAFKRYSRHRKRCPICTPIGAKGTSVICALAQALRASWRALDTLIDEPSRWTTVETIQPLPIRAALTYQPDRVAALAVGALIETLAETLAEATP